jgi:hypothetical protein
VANLFYNMARRTVGLVGLWDVVAFDEVAGISFKDKDGVQIMKDYMASGSFARGRDQVNAYASMVFVGNINQPVDTLVKTSHLLAPFPEAMIDSAFFDRFHAYIPGWEIPKMRPEYFTNQYGLIVDYLAEYFREMRKAQLRRCHQQAFQARPGPEPAGHHRRQAHGLRAAEAAVSPRRLRQGGRPPLPGLRPGSRRRVKEQLKKIGGMEFYDVHFSYIDQETREERFISVPEQGGGRLIPDGPMNPGVLHVVATGSGGHLGLYRMETQVTAGNGTLKMSGLGTERLGQGIHQGRLRLLQSQRRPRQRLDQARRARLPPAHRRIAEHRPQHGHGPAHLRRPVLGRVRQTRPILDGRARNHEPGRQHRAGREPGRHPASSLRHRSQTHPAADGQRRRHPQHPRRTIRQIPNQLLPRPPRRRLQGAGGGVAQRFPVDMSFEMGEAPEWLSSFWKSFDCSLIEEQRLLRMDMLHETRVPRMQRAVTEFSEHLQELIGRALTKYGEKSQQLDRSFPQRMLSSFGSPAPSTEQITKRYSELERLCADLRQASLVEPESPMLPLQEAGLQDEHMLKVLALYADDLSQKLSVFQDLYRRITLFVDLMNNYFTHKSVQISREGIGFKTETGDMLDPASLSSGEQHILVLFFSLLFKSPSTPHLVLIDEPELSLHPRWQMRLVDDLVRIRELSQTDFILASHSPQIFQGHWEMARDLEI